MNGWFAMNRAMFEHPLFAGKPERIAAWAWIIATTAWKDTRQDANGKTVTVKRGQLLTSYRQMSRATGVPVQPLRTLIEKLQGEGAINTDTNTGRLLITIRNYDKYQAGENSSNTAPTREQHSSNTQNEQGNNSAKADGDKSPADPTKFLFDSGVRLLGAAGISNKQARALVGKWRSQNSDEAVFAALGMAQREGAIDPVPFIERCLKFAAKRKSQDSGNGYGAFGNIPERC